MPISPKVKTVSKGVGKFLLHQVLLPLLSAYLLGLAQKKVAKIEKTS